MQKTFTGRPPADDQEAQEVLRHIANGEYEILLFSNYGKGQSLLQARYVILRQPGRAIEEAKGMHSVTIEPIPDPN